MRSDRPQAKCAARQRSALRASDVRMFSRSGPRTDGRCAEGPRVEWFDGEARPTYDSARVPNGLPLRPRNNFSQNRLLLLSLPAR